jgi:translocator protein
VDTIKKRGILDIVIAISVAVALSGIGGAVTAPTILEPWYQALVKPAWQPPGPAFGIIWTTIYVLGTAAAVLAWRSTTDQKWHRNLVWLFGVNIVLNLLWSVLFFQLLRPDWSLIEVVPFWLSIAALVVYIWPKHKVASLLLTPYLVWVGIATFLNLAIVQLNGPF